MLSAAERHGSSRGSWNTRPIRGSGAVIGSPSSVTVAAVRGEQAGDDAQQRRLAAAVRADERDDAAARRRRGRCRRGPAARPPSRIGNARSTPSIARVAPDSRPRSSCTACRERHAGRARPPDRAPCRRRTPGRTWSASSRSRLEPALDRGSSRGRRSATSGHAPDRRPRRGSPSRAPRSRARPARATGKPVTSALIWFHDVAAGRAAAGAHRGRPSRPAASIGVGDVADREARSPRGSPARGGRGRGARVRPANAPVALGSQIGDRSPARYGRKTTPSAPGGVARGLLEQPFRGDAAAEDRRRGTSRARGRWPPSRRRRCTGRRAGRASRMRPATSTGTSQ